MTRPNTVLAALVALVVLAGGCAPTLQPHPERAGQVDRFIPKAFGPEAPAPDQESSARTDWRAFFDDPHLQRLIEEALENNQELRILEQGVRIARAEAYARGGEVLPQAGIGADVGVGTPGSYPVGRTGPRALFEGEGAVGTEYGVGLYASWEVDVWSKLRNATKAALYEYAATVEGRNFAVTTLVAELASAYYELMALDQQLRVIDANLALLGESLAAVRLQKQAARVTELAVQRFEAEVLKVQSHRVELTQERTEAENRINLLVGRAPQRVERSADGLDKLVPKTLQAGVPTKLLENRPDIRRAELELKAAALNVEVARATFYPSLSIEAGVGFRADHALGLLSTPESLAIGSVANLFVPLLNRRAIEANYRAADAAQLRAVYEYERAVLSAYVECATLIAQLDRLSEALERRQAQVRVLDRSIEISIILFNSAHADYLEVLTTRAEALESQLELVETRKRQLVATVQMYRALGGGWDRARAAALPDDASTLPDDAP